MEMKSTLLILALITSSMASDISIKTKKLDNSFCKKNILKYDNYRNSNVPSFFVNMQENSKKLSLVGKAIHDKQDVYAKALSFKLKVPNDQKSIKVQLNATLKTEQESINIPFMSKEGKESLNRYEIEIPLKARR